MELINATRMVTDFTMGTEPSGRESLVVVIKGTFKLPLSGEQPQLQVAQLPLVMADTFTGVPGFSAPVYESDYAPRKPHCDVLLLGSAYAPPGRPVSRMRVGMSVGPLHKCIEVVGHRLWETGIGGVAADAPRTFQVMPIGYDNAFGGVDDASDDPAEHAAHAANPVGCGYRKNLRTSLIDGVRMPNTEEHGQIIDAPDRAYRPMAYGPIGRGWQPRVQYAGTYDQGWLENVFPFLPADFDERYYQSAPPDQQIPLPIGPLEVRLEGLTPDGLRQFTLPYFEAPVHVFPKRGKREDLLARLDTILFEPDLERFTMQWRVARPLRDNMLEISQLLVGRKGLAWWQTRDEMSFPIQDISVPSDEDDEQEQKELAG